MRRLSARPRELADVEFAAELLFRFLSQLTRSNHPFNFTHLQIRYHLIEQLRDCIQAHDIGFRVFRVVDLMNVNQNVGISVCTPCL